MQRGTPVSGIHLVAPTEADYRDVTMREKGADYLP